jgi:sugar phosphate isomerase/epimerase
MCTPDKRQLICRCQGHDLGRAALHVRHFTELGKGNIDWPAILKQARAQDIRHAVVDQGDTNLPIPESIRISSAYLRSINI